MKNVTFTKMCNLSLLLKHKNHQNAQFENQQNAKKVSKNIKKRGGLISALKPGPVVPPGTQKTPDQAARISQSVDFGHLSDILAIFRGGVNFWCFFVFLHFLILMILCFSVFLILSLFWFLHFLDFLTFCVLLILINFCHFFMLMINFE